MQNAKRMVLVDETFLEHLYQKEDSSWKRPTEQKAKSLLNRELKSDLDDPSIPDDIKAKQHQQHLNRCLHKTRKLPVAEPEVLIDFQTPSVDDLFGLSLPIKKAKKEKTKVLAVRKSKRLAKIKWDPWE